MKYAKNQAVGVLIRGVQSTTGASTGTNDGMSEGEALERYTRSFSSPSHEGRSLATPGHQEANNAAEPSPTSTQEVPQRTSTSEVDARLVGEGTNQRFLV